MPVKARYSSGAATLYEGRGAIVATRMVLQIEGNVALSCYQRLCLLMCIWAWNNLEEGDACCSAEYIYVCSRNALEACTCT